MRIKRIDKVEVCGPHSLRVVFNDGVSKRVNLLRLLEGPIFEPVRDPAYFGRVLLDPVAGTVVWPNGADLAPEAVYEVSSVGPVPDRASSRSQGTPGEGTRPTEEKGTCGRRPPEDRPARSRTSSLRAGIRRTARKAARD